MLRTITSFLSMLLVSINFGPPKTSPSPFLPSNNPPQDSLMMLNPEMLFPRMRPWRRRQEPDWDRMRFLSYPGAQLIRTAVNQKGRLSANFLTPQDYIDRAGNYFKKNVFFQREIARRAERWGSVMELFSAGGSTVFNYSSMALAGGL